MMIRSILIKLSMLIVAIGAVLALGWPWGVPPKNDRLASDEKIEEPVALTVAGDRQSGQDRQDPFRHATTQTTPDRKLTGTVPVESQLDINHSTARELESLPGIGPVLAQRIIDRRSSVGEFHSLEDLRGVQGLGSKRIDQLRPLIRFNKASKG